MARCPRCLNPVDEDYKCLDSRCSYRMRRDSLRSFWIIFAGVGLVHLALVLRIGLPVVGPPVPATFWLFAAVCWLFVNTAATVLLYGAYVFGYELHAQEYAAWLEWTKRMARATMWSAGPGGVHGSAPRR